MNTKNPFGDVIYSYSRKQAIEDGVLVDLSQFEVCRQHFKFHLACTDTVWNEISSVVQSDSTKDYEGILHDICTMAKIAIRSGKGTNQILFQCIVGHAHKQYKLHIGPGDTATPVLTLMKPNES